MLAWQLAECPAHSECLIKVSIPFLSSPPSLHPCQQRGPLRWFQLHPSPPSAMREVHSLQSVIQHLTQRGQDEQGQSTLTGRSWNLGIKAGKAASHSSCCQSPVNCSAGQQTQRPVCKFGAEYEGCKETVPPIDGETESQSRC